MAAAGPVRLWVRTEPFLVGALPAPPPARLTPHYLRKTAAYARARADQGCFPRLRWPCWRHIACGKLQLSREIAWLYFELFRGLLGPAPPLRLRWAEAAAACANAEELERERSKARARTGRRQGEPRARPRGGPAQPDSCLSLPCSPALRGHSAVPALPVRAAAPQGFPAAVSARGRVAQPPDQVSQPAWEISRRQQGTGARGVPLHSAELPSGGLERGWFVPGRVSPLAKRKQSSSCRIPVNEVKLLSSLQFVKSFFLVFHETFV